MLRTRSDFLNSVPFLVELLHSVNSATKACNGLSGSLEVGRLRVEGRTLLDGAGHWCCGFGTGRSGRCREVRGKESERRQRQSFPPFVDPLYHVFSGSPTVLRGTSQDTSRCHPLRSSFPASVRAGRRPSDSDASEGTRFCTSWYSRRPVKQ